MLANNYLFWFCASSGSSLFLIQLFLSFTGFDSEDGEDSSSPNFKWLSKQAVTGFLMMFGWVGLGCVQELNLPSPLSIVIALCAGILTMFITGSLFKGAGKLKSTGTIFQIEEAIGKEASVYQRIPKNGVGKISISLQQITHEIDALSQNGEEIPSFSQVQIIKKADENTVIVIPV